MSYKFRYQRLYAILFLFLGILCLVIISAYTDPYIGIVPFSILLLYASGIWSYGLTTNDKERIITFNKLGWKGSAAKEIISDKDIEYWFVREIKGSINPLHWFKPFFVYKYFVCKIKNGGIYIYPLNHPYLRPNMIHPINQIIEKTYNIKPRVISDSITFMDRVKYDLKVLILSVS